jgi:hypothetical protein
MKSRQGDICCGLIGHGPTFCIRKNCKTTHHGGPFDVDHNTICVIKTNDVSLFCEPISSREQVDDALFDTWQDDRVLLDEWTERFAFIRSSREVLTDAELKASEALQEAAKNFKTPAKPTQKANDEEIQKMLELVSTEGLYKRKVKSPSDVEKIKRNDLNFLSEVIQGMEEKLEAVTRKTFILDASTEQVTKKVRVELPILFSKTSSLDATIGSKVKVEHTDFAASTVWSSIALLTTWHHDTDARLQDFPKLANTMRYDVVTEMNQKLDHKVANENSATLGKLTELRSLLVSSLGEIGNRFQHEAAKSEQIRFKLASQSHQGGKGIRFKIKLSI